MAAYTNIVAAIAKAVMEARLKVLDEVQAYVLDKVDEDSAEAIKELFDGFKEEFNKSVEDEMKEVKTMKKKGGRKNSSASENTEKRTRKATPYNVFVSENMKRFKVENPSFNGKQIMKMAMDAWKAMSDDEKTAYREKINRQSTSEEDSATEHEPEHVEEPVKKTGKGAAKKTPAPKKGKGKAKASEIEEDEETSDNE